VVRALAEYAERIAPAKAFLRRFRNCGNRGNYLTQRRREQRRDAENPRTPGQQLFVEAFSAHRRSAVLCVSQFTSASLR